MNLRAVIVYHGEVHHIADLGIAWNKRKSYKSFRGIPQIRYEPIGEDVEKLIGTYSEEIECKQKIDENGKPIYQEVVKKVPVWECSDGSEFVG